MDGLRRGVLWGNCLFCDCRNRALCFSFVLLLVSFGGLAIPVYPALSSSVQHESLSSRDSSVPSSLYVQYTNASEQYGLGALPEEIPEEARIAFYAEELPTHLDWTDNAGYNWITPVKMQGDCGACVAFATVATTEARYRIAANDPSWELDLSEQHLFSFGRGAGGCEDGWKISKALDYLQQYGTPDEACFPYRSPPDQSSSDTCSDWQSRAFRILGFSWVAKDPTAIQAALLGGPVVARFDVYEDFNSYTGGVYHYAWGENTGGHAVTIVGYDSIDQYWIVKNSWGSDWGENGYFRIGFGECGIDDSVASISAPGASPQLELIFEQNSLGRVFNDPPSPTTFALYQPRVIALIRTYHWNDARGTSVPGYLSVIDQNGVVYGPWQATGEPGMGGVPNAYWVVEPNLELPWGDYTVLDSDPATWSWNEETQGRGMTWVYAEPAVLLLTQTAPSTTTTPGSTAQTGESENLPGYPTVLPLTVAVVAVLAVCAFVLGRRFVTKKVGREGKELPVQSSH